MKKEYFAVLIPPVLAGALHFVPSQHTASQLMLKTSLDVKHDQVFASAAVLGGGSFGPGIYITCNSMPIVDTRSGNSRSSTGNYVTAQGGMFEWNYEGPDTNFDVEIPALPEPIIADSMNEKRVFISDSLSFGYAPAGPCTNLQLILGDEFQDSIHANTVFDTMTGALYPTWIGSLGLQSGAGTISLSRMKWIYFPTPGFRWVIVEDSVTSKPVNVIWQ